MPPGNGLIKPVSAVYKPPPAPSAYTGNAFGNLGIEGSAYPTSQPQAAAPAAPATPAAPAAAPIDFNAQALIDPEYTQGQALLARNNTMNLKALKDAWLGNSQSSQDSFNSHGGLFSGAAANAQTHLAQDYETAQAKQALDFDQGGSGLYFSVFNRLKQQLGQPLGVTQ